MAYRFHERPFRVLVPAALALIALIAVVALDLPQHRRSLPPPDLSGLEPLFHLELGQSELVARAREQVRAQGIDPDGMLSGVWQHYDRELLDRLRAAHGDAAVLELAARGAPLVTWTVTFYRPLERAAHYAGMSVTLDRGGRVVGFARWRYDPNALRSPVSDEWLAETRAALARRLGIDPARLERRGVTDFVGTELARADAVWQVAGLGLGSTRVVVQATRRQGVLNFSEELFDPSEEPGLSRAGTTTAYWAAMLLATAIAFGLGACARGGAEPPPSRGGERLAIAGGLVLAAAVCGVEAAALWRVGAPVHTAAAAALLLVAALAGLLAALTWRPRRPTATPGRRLRIALIAAVPLSYVVMSIACTGYLEVGCTRACGLLRYTAAPLAVLSLVAAGRDPRFYGYAVLAAAAALVPNCVCDNFLNHPWVGWLGSSPMCYFFPFVVTLVAITGLRGLYPRLCLVAAAAGSVGAAAIGLSHQLLGFPW